MKISNIGELGVIELFQNVWPPDAPGVVKGFRDDCAVMDTGGERLLLMTTDMLVEDVHFSSRTFTPFQLGVRSIAVNLSDIAAMGGTPTFSFLSIGAAAHMDTLFMESFIEGYRECSLNHGSRLLGGDTVSSDRLVINVALLGLVERDGVLFRHTARPGQAVYVSGFLGDAAAGLDVLGELGPDASGPVPEYLSARHRTPEPRVPLGRLLSLSGVRTCIDLSDGLASDLGHICRESGVGARIHAHKIPVSGPSQVWARERHHNPMHWALFGGEDFELLFTAERVLGERVIQRAKEELDITVTEVGEVIEGQGVRLVDGKGEADITGQGYLHFRKPEP